MAVFPPPPPPAIIVSGQAITPAAGDEAFGAVRLGAGDLQSASGRIEDALRGIGGVQLFRTASTRTANPTAEGITARGLAGNASSRVEVTLDGVPLADPFFGFVGWGALIGQPVARAELVRGGGLGGPGALAGTLALVSAHDGGAMVRGGSRNGLEAEAGLYAPVHGGTLGLNAGFSRGDGYLLVERPGIADVPAAYRQWSVAGTAQASVGVVSLEARLSGFADRRLRGIADAEIGSEGGDFSVSARLNEGWRPHILAYGKLRNFTTVTRTLDAARAVATTALDQIKTPASGWGLEAGVEPPLGDDSALRLGAAWRAFEGRTVEQFRYVAGAPTRGRVAGGNQQVASLFANGSHRASDALLLTAAGRVDHWRIGAGRLDEFDLATGLSTLHEPSPARTGTEFSGRLGAVWRPVGAIRLRAAGYRGWRLPTLNELHRPFRAGSDATAANPALNPEHLWGAEAGIGWQPLDGIDLSATLFWNRLADSIANVTLGVGPGVFPGVGFVGAGGRYRQRQNLGAIETHGIEAEARVPLGPLHFRASAAYADARVHGGAIDGLRPAQAPRFSGSAGLGWEGHAGGAAVTLRHVGARFEDDQNQRRLAAATTVDASASVRLGHGLSAEFAAENLADAKIETGFSGSQLERGQPRTLWVGLRWVPAR